jgi:hypothetical protein
MDEYKMARSTTIAWRLGWAAGFVSVRGSCVVEEYRTKERSSWDCGYEAGKLDVRNRDGKNDNQTENFTGKPPPDCPSPSEIAWWLGWMTGHVSENCHYAYPEMHQGVYDRALGVGKRHARKV